MRSVPIKEQVERGREVVRMIPEKTRWLTSRRYRDFAATFATDEGERALAHIAKKAGVFGTGFVPGDPNGTSYKAGARDLAIEIINLSGKGMWDIAARMKELEPDE